jgi:hypothetical protein
MMFRRGPIRRTRQGYRVELSADERAVLLRMVDELAGLLRAGEAPQRLFPTAYPNDPERDEEYQRLMHDELLSSRLAAIEVVHTVLERGETTRDEPEMPDVAEITESSTDGTVTESQLIAFMQSLNALRLVLGELLDVGDDPDREVADDLQDSPEHHLYQYLSWLLEWCVRALSR